jgi:hypothetical protein
LPQSDLKASQESMRNSLRKSPTRSIQTTCLEKPNLSEQKADLTQRKGDVTAQPDTKTVFTPKIL